jgi:rhodanese-related sulfurtransferase
MKNLKYLVLSVLFVSFMLSSCNKETVDEAQVLVEYLEANGDYPSTAMPAMITAQDLYTLNQTGQVYIIDIRSAADFTDKGHIANAVNVPSNGVNDHLATINTADYEKIAIVCYSGQTACWATCLARINGYNNVAALKWGMCSWHADFAGSWPSSVGNMYATQFTSDPTEKGPEGELPVLTTGMETGEEILAARTTAVLAEGFGAAKVTAADVFANPNNYYVVNYWSDAHYTEAGHIPGAMQYTPKVAMQLAEDLKTLPTDKTIAVYCYTGQTSANMAAYLRVLGYDAKSILFGTSGMALDLVTGLGYTHWSDSYIMGYDYVK